MRFLKRLIFATWSLPMIYGNVLEIVCHECSEYQRLSYVICVLSSMIQSIDHSHSTVTMTNKEKTISIRLKSAAALTIESIRNTLMVAEFKESLLLQTDPSSHIFDLLIILTALLGYYDVNGVQDINPSTSATFVLVNFCQ